MKTHVQEQMHNNINHTVHADNAAAARVLKY